MATDTSQISDREREILRLLAEGASNQQIADQLNISINTVKVHVRNIFGKIGVASRTEATLYAVRMGLVHVGASAVAAPLAEAPPAVDAAPAAPADVEVPADAAQPADALSAPEALDDAATFGVQSAHVPIVSPAVDVPRPRIDRRLLLGAGLLVALLVVAIVFVVARPLLQPTPTVVAPTAGVLLPNPDERWRELPELPAARSSFGLAYYDRKLYVIGGEVDGKPSDQVVRYDASTRTWVALSAKPTAVSDVQAVVVGNKIYVPGGRLQSGAISDHLDVYDPQRENWATLKPLPQPRSGYALVAVEGKLYLFGGWDGSAYRAEVWQYDPDQNTWTARTPMPTARAFAGAAVTPEGQVYVVGGEDAAGPLTVNERFTPAQDNDGDNPWTVQAPLPGPHSHMAVTTASELIFVLSGAATTGESLLYNSTIDTWQQLQTPLGPSLRDLRALAVGNNLYILGGRDASTASARFYEYQALYSVLLPLESRH
jgi:DNA-binding CsgD family transcriptional regulator/N-acetylneuraminic acid mutarotase